MQVHAFSQSTAYLQKACESQKLSYVPGLLGLLHILSPNSAIVSPSLYTCTSNFRCKQNKSICMHQFVFLGRKFVLFVVIKVGSSYDYKDVCLPREVISIDCFTANAFLLFRRIRQSTLSIKQNKTIYSRAKTF